MAGPAFQALPGFRDFTPRECAIRNYLFETWRSTARRAGFVEYETPLVEDTGLYLKKSGGELSKQLFRFTDQGGRDVTLRPEVTASLARLAGEHQRQHAKPMKWFEIGPCFRYEKPQKGRGREFLQFNADILGEAGPAADAELVALAVETMLALGFLEGDFVVRISDRHAWSAFAAGHGLDADLTAELLEVVDKLDRMDATAADSRLKALGTGVDEVRAFIADPASASPACRSILADLAARGMDAFVQADLSIVRGLAYYTGVVFEVFDARHSMRAIAGGGRYDSLVATVTDGAVDLPAAGFAMGDHVIRNLIEETPHALMRLEVWLMRHTPACDVYVVVADELMRAEALSLVTRLRRAGVATDFALVHAKVPRQFQLAERTGARFALVVGSEFPQLKLKVLSSRAEESGDAAQAVEWITERLLQPDGPLIAG